MYHIRTSNQKEKKVSTKHKALIAAVGLTAVLGSASGAENQEGTAGDSAESIQKIRFVEDDAQNYMTSKIYELKNQKANDVVPFLLGAIKRYAKNGTADRINYSAGKQQLVAVSCPEPLIPYIDDMIEKLDRPGSAVAGTGILRSVYKPVWRKGEDMVDIMTSAGISANVDAGADQDALVEFDAHTNLIYWKDSINKDKDLKKYLAWLDRPVPQCEMTFKVYEVREADLLDLGLDYQTWKNGPGLDVLSLGASYLTGDGKDFGPYGYFTFAPSIDFSFIRMLQDTGRATLALDATLTLRNGTGASLSFAPVYQNIKKADDFTTSIEGSENDGLSLSIASPVISLAEASETNTLGLVNFTYSLTSKNVVERDTNGNELYDSFSESGTVSVTSGNEFLLTDYVFVNEVEQTVGVPFLCELPVLKYIFGTTTRNKERTYRFVTVQAELRHPDAEIASATGRMLRIDELLNNETEDSDK